jgi:Domain of unknown function (DUF4157)/Bacterial protein of unknown function (DUF922)
MSDRKNLQRKKGNTSTIANPLLVSSSTPTLVNSSQSLSSQVNTVVPDASVRSISRQQDPQSNNEEQSLEVEAFNQEPLGHDLSRISLRSQSKLSAGESIDPPTAETNWTVDRLMRRSETENFMSEPAVMRFRGHDFSQMSVFPTDRFEPSPAAILPTIQRACDACDREEQLEPDILQRYSFPDVQRTPDLQRDPNGMPPKKGTTKINKLNTTITASGKTLTEAIVNLTSQGRGEAGSVTCLPEKDVKTYQADDKSVPIIYEADVVVTETKAMPVWTELAQQCEPVQKEWNRFYQALDAHENGHISIDEKAFANAHRQLLGKSESAADTTFNNIYSQANTDNTKYDGDTQHGLTQGTKVTPVQCGIEKLSESESSPIENTNLTSDIPSADSTPLMAKIQPSWGHDLSKISIFPLRAKLSVSQPGDPYEQEADRVADEVMRMQIPESNEAVAMRSIQATISRKCTDCEREKFLQPKLTIQRSGKGNLQTEDDLESRLNSSKGGGNSLPDDVRSFMEPRFGADFSEVRVHTGSDAVQMNRDVNAQAFAHGNDIYFGAGKSPGNNELTAHELTHVVQQTGQIQAQAVPLKGVTSTNEDFKRRVSSPVRGVFAGKKVGTWGAWISSDLTTTIREARNAATIEEASAWARGISKPACILKEPIYLSEQDKNDPTDAYITYGLNVDSILGFTAQNTKLHGGGVTSSVKGVAGVPVIHFVTEDGTIISPEFGKDGAANYATLMTQQDRPPGNDPFSGQTQAFGQGLQGLRTGNVDKDKEVFLRQFDLVLHDTAQTVLAESEKRAISKRDEISGKGIPEEDWAKIDAALPELIKIADQIARISGPIGEIARTSSKERIEELSDELDRLNEQRNEQLSRYPLLSQFDEAGLHSFKSMNRDDRTKVLKGTTVDVLVDIQKTRENIRGGGIDVWEIGPLVESTLQGLAVKDADFRGWALAKAKFAKNVSVAFDMALGVIQLTDGRNSCSRFCRRGSHGRCSRCVKADCRLLLRQGCREHGYRPEQSAQSKGS